jgi:hypothetical protein
VGQSGGAPSKVFVATAVPVSAIQTTLPSPTNSLGRTTRQNQQLSTETKQPPQSNRMVVSLSFLSLYFAPLSVSTGVQSSLIS